MALPAIDIYRPASDPADYRVGGARRDPFSMPMAWLEYMKNAGKQPTRFEFTNEPESGGGGEGSLGSSLAGGGLGAAMMAAPYLSKLFGGSSAPAAAAIGAGGAGAGASAAEIAGMDALMGAGPGAASSTAAGGAATGAGAGALATAGYMAAVLAPALYGMKKTRNDPNTAYRGMVENVKRFGPVDQWESNPEYIAFEELMKRMREEAGPGEGGD